MSSSIHSLHYYTCNQVYIIYLPFDMHCLCYMECFVHAYIRLLEEIKLHTIHKSRFGVFLLFKLRYTSQLTHTSLGSTKTT